MASNQQAGGGVGFVGLLLLVFITLKLTHVIDWSWWWVLAPAWVMAIIVIVFIVFFLGIGVIVSHYNDRKDMR